MHRTLVTDRHFHGGFARCAGEVRRRDDDRTGVGALAFCGMVILTMFAAETFDPRLMWMQRYNALSSPRSPDPGRRCTTPYCYLTARRSFTGNRLMLRSSVMDGASPKRGLLSDCAAAGIGKPVLACDLRDAVGRSVRSPQGTPRQVHSTQPQIAARAHAEILLAMRA